MYKEIIISKHAKKFASNDKKIPILHGIHYAADGTVYATNRHYALRIKNAHKFAPVTLHAKTGVPIDGQYPDVASVFDKAEFDNELIIHNKLQLEQAHFIADCALAVAVKIDKKVPTIRLSSENGPLYLSVKHENQLTFQGFFGNLLNPKPLISTLNAQYFVNALEVFLEAPPSEVKIKFKGKLDPILITDESDIDVLILPFRTP